RGKVFVSSHWVDAGWGFPPPATARAGTRQVFTTVVFRQTDHRPLANYRVRYKVLDGPPAVFLQSQAAEAVAASDLNGQAAVTLAQAAPALGVTHVAVQVIRPPDPTAPSGVGIVLAIGATQMEWLAPAVALDITGPPAVLVQQDVPYTITVTNTGRIETRSMTVQSAVPDGLEYVGSEPPAVVEGKQLTWTLGGLPEGKAHVVQAMFKSLRVGPV